MRPTSLQLTQPALNLPSTSNPASATDIQSLVKMSGADWINNNQQLSFIGTDYKNYRQLQAALDKIGSTDTGRTLLKCIKLISQFKSKKLTIFLDSNALMVTAHCNTDAENFRGTGSNFHCNFKIIDYFVELGMSLMDFQACVVFHELLHVLHNLNGERLRVVRARTEAQAARPFLFDEARTVGLGSFSEEDLTENKFREEIGVYRRTFYTFSCFIINDDNTLTMNLNYRLNSLPL